MYFIKMYGELKYIWKDTALEALTFQKLIDSTGLDNITQINPGTSNEIKSLKDLNLVKLVSYEGDLEEG